MIAGHRSCFTLLSDSLRIQADICGPTSLLLSSVSVAPPPPFPFESCMETDSHARGQILPECLCATCEHLQLLRACISSLFLNSPNIILHPMHMSHSCVLRRIICTTTRADRLIVAGNADSFLSGLPVSPAYSRSSV